MRIAPSIKVKNNPGRPSAAPEQSWCADLHRRSREVHKDFPPLAPATAVTEVEANAAILVNRDDVTVIRGTQVAINRQARRG